MTKPAAKTARRKTHPSASLVGKAVAAKTYSVANFDTKTLSEKGVACPILDLVTFEPTGVEVIVHGQDSNRYRAALVDQARRINDIIAATGKDEISVEDKEAMEIDLFAKCTSAFVNMVNPDGTPFECTLESATDFYTRCPAIRRQIDKFFFRRANFLQA